LHDASPAAFNAACYQEEQCMQETRHSTCRRAIKNVADTVEAYAWFDWDQQ